MSTEPPPAPRPGPAPGSASSVPSGRLKWNGWGYDDSEFAIAQNGNVYVTGKRYRSAGVELPHFRPWVEQEIGVECRIIAPSGPLPSSLPGPRTNSAFVEAIKGHALRMSSEPIERLHHSHGHTAQEIYLLRYGWPKDRRIPDLVVYPGSHEHVVAIVEAANKHNVVIIPFGGGTSVTYALTPPQEEERMIVSLDMKEMKAIKWIDRENMTACLEAGLVGQDLQARLSALGLTMGHEPDSAEFSTVGGWIATRASGMKKNKYGNMEDILVNCKLVTPSGVLVRDFRVPRVSAGPDINEVILGSEGTLGVVTEAVVRIQPAPECQIFGAIAFPTYEQGILFMRDVGFHRAQPASLRLVDNEQFRFGHALKPGSSTLATLFESVKKKYLTQWLGFNLDQLAACTIVFEGNKTQVAAQQKIIYALAKKHGGVKADAASGQRGYELTYMIAYLRDFGFQLGFMSESFETSVPWSQTALLCRRVKERVRQEARDLQVKGEPFASCRVTQVYDEGCAVYFYIAIQFQGLHDPVATFSKIEHAAREEILKHGGSVSHHHGIGKHRKSFMHETIGNTGIKTLQGIKKSLDPNNVFASGNLYDVEEKGDKETHKPSHRPRANL